ncbi:MAG: nitrilase-related carbon-nitrogen hydrolase [bacterium]
MKNSSRKKIRVALLQFASVDGAVAANERTLFRLLRKLKAPVDLIVLPEMWPSGFRVIEGSVLLRETRRVLARLQEYARERKATLIGSHLEKGRGGYYNTATVIDARGRLAARYHKVHLFQLGGENKTFLPGRKIAVAKLPWAKVGLSICYDIRFPELIRKQVLSGAEILAIPSAWPRERIDHYLSLLKARAIENLCFVVSANKVGKNAAGIVYGGHSVAYDPWGRKLGELKKKEGILKVTLDLNSLIKIRASFPVFEARREDVY